MGAGDLSESGQITVADRFGRRFGGVATKGLPEPILGGGRLWRKIKRAAVLRPVTPRSGVRRAMTKDI